MPTIKVNNLNLHYEEYGPADGKPIVLVGGWTASSGLFKEFAAALASRYRVICPDMRGHGKSDKPWPGEYSPEVFSKDVHALLAAIGLRRPIAIFGQSMGGMIALDYALRFPDETSALIVANSKAQLMGSFKDKLLWEMMIFMYGMSPAGFFGRMIPSFFHHPPDPQVSASLVAMSLQVPKPIGVSVIRGAARTDYSRELGRIRIPTLVIETEFDQPDIKAGTKAIAAGIPNARLETVPDSAHLPFIEQKALVVEKITEFLN